MYDPEMPKRSRQAEPDQISDIYSSNLRPGNGTQKSFDFGAFPISDVWISDIPSIYFQQ